MKTKLANNKRFLVFEHSILISTFKAKFMSQKSDFLTVIWQPFSVQINNIYLRIKLPINFKNIELNLCNKHLLENLSDNELLLFLQPQSRKVSDAIKYAKEILIERGA